MVINLNHTLNQERDEQARSDQWAQEQGFIDYEDYLDTAYERHQPGEEIADPCGLKVGDILYASWRTNQTNVGFYLVIEIIGKRKVKLVEIGHKTKYESLMTGTVCPDPQDERSPPFERTVTADMSVKINERAMATPWDGKPKYKSWYG